MSNPLVAQAQSQTTGVTGIGIAESAVDLANGVSDGSWVEAGLGAVGVGLEVLSLVVDPIGTLASYGVSWLIEHVQPLKEALDWLAGDPPVIQSFSDTWANVAAEVNAIAGDLGNEVTNGTAGWQGEGAEAYRGAAAEQADALAGAASLADGISAGVMIMGTVVAAVRELVRDLVAELVGKLITWALEAAATLGFATPAIAVQATTAITKTISKISEFIRKLVKTIGNVSPKIRKIIDKLGEIIEKLSKMLRKGGKPGSSTTPSGAKPGTTKTPDTTPNSPDTTPNTPDNPDTTPSGTDTTPGNPGGRNDPGNSSMRDNAGDPDADARQQECAPGSGDPVDLATGQMFMSQFDVELPGVLPLAFQRTYFSSARVGRWFGRSWISTVDQRIEIEDDAVYFAAADGARLRYPLPTPGGAELAPVSGPGWRLSATTADEYLLRQPELGRELRFAGTGKVRPIESISDRNGNRIEFDYDESGAPARIRHDGGYQLELRTANDRVTELLLHNAHGADISLVRYDYDENGRLRAVRNSSDRPMEFEYGAGERIIRWRDRNDEWYGYTYDHHGRVVRTEGSGGALVGTWLYDTENRRTVYTDALGHPRTYQFDEAFRIVREIDPLGNLTVQEWDGYNRLRSRTDPLGRTTRYEYDEDGNLVALTRPDGARTLAEYNAFGQATTVVATDGAVLRQEYDDRGNLIAVTDPAGARTTYTYDDRGVLTAGTDALGRTRRVLSDGAGLALEVIDPRGGVTKYERDQFGRAVAVTHPGGGVTRFAWTVEGQLLARTLPDGSTERWTYDGEGNQVEHVDPTGRVNRFHTTHFDLAAGETGPDGARHGFTYDAELRLTEVRNPQGLTWRYEYDAAGHLLREVDFNGRELRYTYDAAGQLVERVNGAGVPTRFVRDAVGKVVERVTEGSTTRFAYDEAGRVVRAQNADADVVFQRDPLGRIVAETVNGRTTRYRYDAAGRKVWRRTPQGRASSWEYGDLDEPKALRTAGRTLSFGYDESGREVERLLDSGTITAQAWDRNDRLVSQTVSAVAPGGVGARVLRRRDYRYQANGYLTAIEDQHEGNTWFDLDPSNRVRRVESAGRAESYEYDAAGNVSSASWRQDGGQTHTFEGALLREAGNLRYQHDRQGRVVLRQRKRLSAKPDNWHFAWNNEDRLVGLTTPDGARWRYRYDAFGRRVAKERLDEAGRVVEWVEFTWDGAVLTEQADHTGRVVSWEFEPGSPRPLAQVESGGLAQSEVDSRFYSIVTDLVGTPTELVDERGNYGWRRRTNLWGEAVDETSNGVDTPLRFPGQYFDAESRLHYNFHRYYDPEIARYYSPDPLGLAPSPNPYAYVHNPTGWIDPFGLTATNPTGGTGPCPKGGSAANNPATVNETTAPKPVKPEDAVDNWDEFLGEGTHTNIHPRTGQPDADRIVSEDGTRSIRYGAHEMGGKPTKHHYHEETWSQDPTTGQWHVENTQVRVPIIVKKPKPPVPPQSGE
ncbi:RHS repeat-associated core domain-containing protein [Amycolatopsis lurida]